MQCLSCPPQTKLIDGDCICNAVNTQNINGTCICVSGYFNITS
jgi:hypothetical protein